MVAGSPVQGLTSWKVSVTPWNGSVVDSAWAKAGPAVSPISRGMSSRNSFRAMWHPFPDSASRDCPPLSGDEIRASPKNWDRVGRLEEAGDDLSAGATVAAAAAGSRRAGSRGGQAADHPCK